MHDHRLERLTFFSDAVYAIAMTLLVIELRVPHLTGLLDDRAFLQALIDMLPSFIGFLTSFLVIGTFWVAHHRALGMVAHYGPRLAWANLLLLLAIVFLPFASAFMSDYYGGRVPTMLYMVTLCAAGLLQRRLMRLALAPERLADEADRREVNGLLRRMWAVPSVSALALAVTWFAPMIAPVVLLLIPVAIRLLERSGRQAPVAAWPDP